MKTRLRALSRVISRYDQMLYVRQVSQDLACIYRKVDPLRRTLSPRPQGDHLIFCLTDNWEASGNPADRGIEQILATLQAQDSNNRDVYEEAVKVPRERQEKQKERSFTEDLRDRAKDMRRDFAKTIKDYNVHSLDRSDKRKRHIEEKKEKQL